MLLERTIAQLDIGAVPQEQAEDLGHLGYLQWLGALRGSASYQTEAARAHAMAQPFAHSSPAIAVFCGLIRASLAAPLQPLDLRVPKLSRKGGARARRRAS